MVTGVFFSTEYLVPSIETRLVEKEKMAVYNMEEEGPVGGETGRGGMSRRMRGRMRNR